jgi:uncharacterized membrane protein
MSSNRIASDASSHDISMVDVSDPVDAKINSGKGIRWIHRLNYVIKGCAIAALISFVATIVLLGLTQARIIQPALALCSFSASIAFFLVAKIVDCVQETVAKKHNIDLTQGRDAVKQPKQSLNSPEKEKK